MGLIVGKMADFGFLLASWVVCLWLWNFWVYDFMGMKFSKFMGCYDFLGLWGFYEFFFFLEFSGLFVWCCVVNWASLLLLHLWKCLGWWQEIVVGLRFFFFFFWGTNWQWVWVLGKKKKKSCTEWPAWGPQTVWKILSDDKWVMVPNG